jgi:hypothetical protein
MARTDGEKGAARSGAGRRRRRWLVAAGAAAVLAVATASGAAAAIRPFQAEQTVVGGCASTATDAVTTSSGALAGFATCPSPSGDLIRFFSRDAGGTVAPSVATGFTGRVLGVTADATATYVMYATSSEIRVGKRTTAGAFSSRAIDTWSGVGQPAGDVIAQGGQWFGVWSKQVGPGGEFAQTELFHGGTTLATRQITTTAVNLDDHSPSLAWSGTIPVLIWVRTTAPAMPGPSDLMVKKYVGGAWEADRTFATLGTDNTSPDVAIAGGRTFVTWVRDGFVMVAGNATGSFTSHRFNTGGDEPNVAASTTAGAVDHVFVAWRASAADRVFFAESATSGDVQGTWDGAPIAATGTRPFAVGGVGTKATVTYGTGAAVAVQAQS